MKRGVGYVRVSTARQELSPAAQIERLRQFASFSDIELPSERIVVDLATSGRTRFESREYGQAALTLLESADVIIFAKLSRAFRNAADALTLVPRLLKAGKDVAFLDLGISVSTPTGKMVMGMLAVQAEWEADIISERTREALDEASRNGKKLGGVPFGWKSAAQVVDGRKQNGGVHVPVETEQQTIRMIRAMRNEKLSFREIALYLNNRSVPSARGERWHSESVRRVASR